MTVIAESALRILIPRRNSPGHLRHATRQLIRQAIAQIHAESRAGRNPG
ncbi:hypothetical protein [Azohydromonas aeria]|nr:hypothetical protein [Azohydromonas aeria]